MEPLPYKEPHRPPALSYESPLNYDAAANRHRAWAERTRRIAANIRTFLLTTFAIVWLIAVALFKLRITDNYSPTGGFLIATLACLAYLYVVLVAVGSAHRPAAILPRLLVFALIAIGWSYTVTAGVDIATRAYRLYYAYGLRGLNLNHRPSTLHRDEFVVLLYAAALTAAGVMCYVLLQVFAHNRTYRPKINND